MDIGGKDAQVNGVLFKDVRYYITGDIPDKVHSLLCKGGAKENKHLSDFTTHVITGENANDDDVSLAREIYEKPTVTFQWVIYSIKCGKQLPLEGFLPDRNQVFSGVKACLSQLDIEDSKYLWALVSFYGGKCTLTLDKTCTHLILGKPKGTKYEDALESEFHVVSPDWVIESLQARERKEEIFYHPRLLITLSPTTPQASEKLPVSKGSDCIKLSSPDIVPSVIEELKKNLIDNKQKDKEMKEQVALFSSLAFSDDEDDDEFSTDKKSLLDQLKDADAWKDSPADSSIKNISLPSHSVLSPCSEISLDAVVPFSSGNDGDTSNISASFSLSDIDSSFTGNPISTQSIESLLTSGCLDTQKTSVTESSFITSIASTVGAFSGNISENSNCSNISVTSASHSSNIASDQSNVVSQSLNKPTDSVISTNSGTKFTFSSLSSSGFGRVPENKNSSPQLAPSSAQSEMTSLFSQPFSLNNRTSTNSPMSSITGSSMQVAGNICTNSSPILPTNFPSNTSVTLSLSHPSSVPSKLPSSLPISVPVSSTSSLPTTLSSNLPSLLSDLPCSIPSNLPTSLSSNVTCSTSLSSSVTNSLSATMPSTLPFTNISTTIPSIIPTALSTNVPVSLQPSFLTTATKLSTSVNVPTSLSNRSAELGNVSSVNPQIQEIVENQIIPACNSRIMISQSHTVAPSQVQSSPAIMQAPQQSLQTSQISTIAPVTTQPAPVLGSQVTSSIPQQIVAASVVRTPLAPPSEAIRQNTTEFVGQHIPVEQQVGTVRLPASLASQLKLMTKEQQHAVIEEYHQKQLQEQRRRKAVIGNVRYQSISYPTQSGTFHPQTSQAPQNWTTSLHNRVRPGVPQSPGTAYTQGQIRSAVTVQQSSGTHSPSLSQGTTAQSQTPTIATSQGAPSNRVVVGVSGWQPQGTQLSQLQLPQSSPQSQQLPLSQTQPVQHQGGQLSSQGHPSQIQQVPQQVSQGIQQQVQSNQVHPPTLVQNSPQQIQQVQQQSTQLQQVSQQQIQQLQTQQPLQQVPQPTQPPKAQQNNSPILTQIIQSPQPNQPHSTLPPKLHPTAPQVQQGNRPQIVMQRHPSQIQQGAQVSGGSQPPQGMTQQHSQFQVQVQHLRQQYPHLSLQEAQQVIQSIPTHIREIQSRDSAGRSEYLAQLDPRERQVVSVITDIQIRRQQQQQQQLLQRQQLKIGPPQQSPSGWPQQQPPGQTNHFPSTSPHPRPIANRPLPQGFTGQTAVVSPGQGSPHMIQGGQLTPHVSPLPSPHGHSPIQRPEGPIMPHAALQGSTVPQNLVNQQNLVHPKTKTALANLLTNRLSGSVHQGTIVPQGGQGQVDIATHVIQKTAAVPAENSQGSTGEQVVVYQRRTLANIGNVANVRSPAPGTPVHNLTAVGGASSYLRGVAVSHASGSAGVLASTGPHQRPLLYGHDINMLPRELCMVGCVFYIADYHGEVTMETLNAWKRVIQLHGGEVINTYAPSRVTHFLCKHQKSPLFQQAIRDNKRCITIHWVNDILVRGKMAAPWQAIHLPTPFKMEEQPLKDMIIGVTGFENEEKITIRLMLELAGAKYTGYFSSHNDALVCKKFEGAKVNKARELKKPVVNGAWLSEVLLGQNTPPLVYQATRYQTFLEDPLTTIDSSLASHHLLNAWKYPISVLKELVEKAKAVRERVLRKRNSEREADQENKRSRLENIPLASLTAAAGLKNPLDSTSAADNQKPKILLSSVKNKDEMERKIQELGGTVSVSSKDATHLVISCDQSAPRTVKLMCAVSCCQYILNHQWLVDSYSQQKFLPEANYCARLPEYEKLFDFDLRETLRKPNRRHFLAGLTFYLTPSVVPGKSFLRDIIENAGGTVDSKRKSIADIREKNKIDMRYICLVADRDIHLIKDILEDKQPVYNPEFVLIAILKQTLDKNLGRFDEVHR